MVLYLNWHLFMHKVFRGLRENLRENSLNCKVNPYCNNLKKKKKIRQNTILESLRWIAHNST